MNFFVNIADFYLLFKKMFVIYDGIELQILESKRKTDAWENSTELFSSVLCFKIFTSAWSLASKKPLMTLNHSFGPNKNNWNLLSIKK